MEEEARFKGAFEEGYDGAKFLIDTVVKKRKDGSFLCSGKIQQGRAVLKEEYDWEIVTIEAEAVSDDYTHASNLVLEQLYGYMFNRGFYLFDEEEESVEGKNNL